MTNPKVKSQELFETPDEDLRFKQHLSIENNNRLVFSAKFGDGKTTFLREFFKKNENDYVKIHLYPVNYSVASNEDIFELIKFNIFFELLSYNNLVDESKDTLISFAKKYVKGSKTKLIQLLATSLKAIPELGDIVSDSLQQIIDLIDDVLKEYKKSQESELDTIESYLAEFANLRGSIIEDNFYTQLITELVDKLCRLNTQEDKRKQSVLVIDDLDRIDPEHIFRLLNIFAAHQDHYNGNKFGFDKIIVVCDIDNIRNVFHHRYGTNTDFNGYIDKFYSSDVFYYSIKRILKEELAKILSLSNGDENFTNLVKKRTMLQSEIIRILSLFIEGGIINTRNIIKVKNVSFIIPYYLIGLNRDYNIQYYGLILFNILKSILGTNEVLLEAFKRLSESNNPSIELKSSEPRRFSLILFPLYAATKYIDLGMTVTYYRDVKMRTEIDRIKFNFTNDYMGDMDSNMFVAVLEEKEKDKTKNINSISMYYQILKMCIDNDFLK